MKKKVAIVGAGFSSLAASCYLAKHGFDVTVIEKNSTPGGRAAQFKKDGFTFDRGPSWYWMPDIFEAFFNDFNTSASRYYHLTRLNPAYKVFFSDNKPIEISGLTEQIEEEFEKIEPGSARRLRSFLSNAGKNYRIAMNDIVYKPGYSPFELLTIATVKRLGYFFEHMQGLVYKNFKNPKIRLILQFPVLFIGAKPSKTPAFYNFMNYADFQLGTWYPEQGFFSVVNAMVQLSTSLGVSFKFGETVEKMVTGNDERIRYLKTSHGEITTDFVLSGADYHHTETLLSQTFRNYSESYWDKKVFSPSALLFYFGIDKKVQHLLHHNLFFDADFDTHTKAIYDKPQWPEQPLFYANFPSITDKTTAPKGKEACFLLLPIAPGIEDNAAIRQHYKNLLIKRIECATNQRIEAHIMSEHSFCINDFISRYNAYKGNAYGLANTLFQTAFLRPKLKSKKVKNLFFTGQLTVPGPGVPPAIISGKIASNIIIKEAKKRNYWFN